MALVSGAHLTVALVLTEVLVVRHELVLVVDADQGVPRRQLLVKLFLC